MCYFVYKIVSNNTRLSRVSHEQLTSMMLRELSERSNFFSHDWIILSLITFAATFVRAGSSSAHTP
jgi:hypothetical protein